jgi:DNA topoisomerase 6 subunit A-like protein
LTKVKNRSQKSIVFEVMEEAAENARGDMGGEIVNARSLFYAVRALYANRPERPANKPTLVYHYFSQHMIPEYQERFGPIPGLIREPRGRLLEPHTAETVELGTEEVGGYHFPDYVFDKILLIEKEGQMPLFRASEIAERHDMALVSSKGYATDAIRELLGKAHQGDYQLFIFHDADPDGYSLAQTLNEETHRMPGYSVEVIDIGLFAVDGQRLGLDMEPFVRTKGLPKKIISGLNALERTMFVGEQLGPKSWQCHRYEIDALQPASRRIEYVEEQLRENGIGPKVVPPGDYLREYVREEYAYRIGSQVDRAIAELVSSERIKRLVRRVLRDRYGLDNAAEWVEAGLQEDRTRPWSRPIERELWRRSAELRPDLEEVVRRALVKALSARDVER